MIARSGWICALASFVAIAGCALDRAGIAVDRDASAGPRDAGIDAEPSDGGEPLCAVGGCDDGNVCTEDVCNPAIGCVHTPVSGSCDDGVLCNGADSCGDGTCSVHDGVDPCPGSSYCDAASDECMGCESDSDCPGDTVGDWDACSFPSTDVCVQTGTRSRVVRSYTCSASGTCEATDRTETEPCMRSTDGIMCRATTIGTWSACSYADATCGETGTRTRVDTAYVCGAGTCQARNINMTDMAGCARDTDGTSCGSPTAGPWSLCGSYESTCDETGIQNRTVTQPVCASGACTGSVVTPESQACTRDTDGTSCGGMTATCTDWGPCVPPPSGSECSGTGTQTRVCSGSMCTDGSCSPPGSMLESRMCTISTMACVDDVYECETCGNCVGGVGYRLCKANVGTCNSGGRCQSASPTSVYLACTCG